jgi:hypothetical protein
MSIRAQKWSIAALLCIAVFLGWRCCVLLGQVITAEFVDKECKIAQGFCSESYTGPNPLGAPYLAFRLEFLIGYYESRTNTLAGSRLEEIVRRDYEQAVSDLLAALRRETTNDLGSDPHAWIQKYGQ